MYEANLSTIFKLPIAVYSAVVSANVKALANLSKFSTPYSFKTSGDNNLSILHAS